MYYNVLVLLDGSDTSEIVLQYVSSFVASTGGQRVTLLQVVEQVEPQVEMVQGYLEQKAAQLKQDWNPDLLPLPEMTTASQFLEQGLVGDAVIDFATQNDVDAIMLATRGWSGADWWATGSVARHVIRESIVPVYAARLRGGRYPKPGMVKNILVPLDGSLLAEQALPFAEQIARSSGAEITLLHVLKGTTAAKHQAERLDAEKYLAAIAEKLRGSALRVITTVEQGRPGGQIAATAQDQGFDLIVMSSHGRTGPGLGAFGGVTERVLHGCHVPALVIPHRVKTSDMYIGEVAGDSKPMQPHADAAG